MAEAWIALIGALFGGSALKGIDHFLSRNKIKADEDRAWREEMRKDNAAVEDKLLRVQTELDEWKIKYFDMREQRNVQTQINEDHGNK